MTVVFGNLVHQYVILHTRCYKTDYMMNYCDFVQHRLFNNRLYDIHIAVHNTLVFQYHDGINIVT